MTRIPITTTAALGLALLAPAGAGAIYHGSEAPAERFPWLVVLRDRGTVCGGALIAPDRVVTAAHCVQGADPAKLQLLLGGGRIGSAALRELRWKGARLPVRFRDLPSPDDPTDLSKAGSLNDIAVLKLAAPVAGVAPLAIASAAPRTDEVITTVGRGRTGPVNGSGRPDDVDLGAPSDAALTATQRVIDDAACGASYDGLLRPSSHLCTIDSTATAAQACAGDSGGPLVVRRNGRDELVSVVTWGGEVKGRDCGQGLPDVSERVPPHAGLLSGPLRAADLAPWSRDGVRVQRRRGRLTCVVGRWRPSGARLRVSWFRPGAQKMTEVAPGVTRITNEPDRPLPGVHARTIRARSFQLGCSVRASTAGGWASERAEVRVDPPPTR